MTDMCYPIPPGMSFYDAQILLRQIKSESMRSRVMAALADSQERLYEARMKAFEEARKRVGKMSNREILEALYQGSEDKEKLNNRELLEAIYLIFFNK